MSGSEAGPPTGDWGRLEELFRRVVELPEEERAGVLSDLTRGDPSLAAELRDLLQAHDTLARADATAPDKGFLGALDAGRAAALVEESRSGGAGEPDSIGRYRLGERLGQGGMGIVYRAFDSRLERDVALKLLPRWLATDERARKRFSREARAASALDHPNIATIFEVDVADDGRPYIAMAYYPGRTVAQRLEEGALDVDEAVRVAEGMLRGLEAAHRAGIVHRDVKPANVMQAEERGVKLLDFGVAKVAGSVLTRLGTAPGTPAYMSPEQTRGEEVDERSDLWSLGVVLYEMLAGRRPFSAQGPDALIHQIRHDAPTPLRDLRPEVPAPLASLVERCLEKEPGSRPSAAAEVLAALSGGRGGRLPAGPEAVQAFPPGNAGGVYSAVRGWGRPVWILLGVAAVGLSWLLASGVADGAGPVGPASDEEPSIAILPFESLDPGQEPSTYSRGIHDDLITRLSSVSGLRVTSRRAVEGLRGDERTMAEVADALGVRWVLEGSVASSDGGLRVNARLVDPRTESQAWARGYRRSLTAESLQELPGEIATEVALTLDARSPSPDPGSAPLDLATYRSWVEGRANLEQRTEAGLRRGVEGFREALARTSDHAPSWAGLSEALALLANYGYEAPDAVLPEAREAVDRALALAPELADAHASLGLLLQLGERDGPASLEALRRALALEPSNARAALWLGNLLVSLGRLEDARVPLLRAMEVDPTSPVIRTSLARWYQFADSQEVALEHARLAARLAPSSPFVHMVVGELLRELDRPGEAQVVLERARSLPGMNPRGFPGLWVELALAYESQGEVERAEALLAEIDDRTPSSVRAAAEASRGHGEEALALLAASPVVPEFAGVFRYHHVWEPIRQEPAFQEMLAQYDSAWGIGGGSAAPP